MRHIIRIGLLAVLAMSAVAGARTTGRQAPQQTALRTVVLAELFTSEGCSSCPPADALLRRLLTDQPLDGIEIVALGNHVDYWDRLGWRDPFSSPLFSQRQSSYSAAVFGSDRIYTPQIVVDGRLESVGNDEASVRRNILKAAQEPRAIVEVSATPTADATMRIEIRAQVSEQVLRKGNAELMIAVTEDGLVSRVIRGENGGRTLAHSAVVRLLKIVAQVGMNDRSASGTLVVKLAKDWNTDHLRLVGFLQETGSRRILGAGATKVRASSSSQ